MSVDGFQDGDFCWYEIGTRDVDGTRNFYSQLLGWRFEGGPMPGSEDDTYHMMLAGDHGVGGLMEMKGEQFEGVPPHWMSYVYAEDIDATAAKAKELGGQVMNGPFDIPGVGRMAVLQDPAGTVFCIYRGDEAGGGPLAEPKAGTVGWNEIITRDVEASRKFFSELFGLGVKEMPMGDAGTYHLLMRGEQQLAGMMQLTEEWGDAPSHIMNYITVENCDATADKAKELGATVVVPATDIEGIGRFSVIRDPQGAHVSVMSWSM